MISMIKAEIITMSNTLNRSLWKSFLDVIRIRNIVNPIQNFIINKSAGL